MTRRPSRLVLLGHPVGHSLSPRFHNAALEHLGLALRYDTLDVPPERLDDVLGALVAEGAAGNVTIPHKEGVAARCRHLTVVAERCGAVNTFWVEADGTLAGDNTDVAGFDALVRETMGTMPAGIRVAVLGAGGGARAVLTAVEGWRECTVALHNRSATRAAALAARFPVVTDLHDEVESAVRGAALVVNATSVGLEDDRVPCPIDLIPPRAALVDLVYRPGETAWVRAAREHGHAALDGRLMLLEQGACAFERWFGVPAPRAVMRRALGA